MNREELGMYNKEDLKFYNMKKISIGYKKEVLEIETELSIEEKIKFIDEVEDGIASYMINILTKWENEKDSLPKDNYGSPKTVSKKAWIKKNDERKIINIEYSIGNYYLFGTKYTSMSLTCPTTEHGYQLFYTDDDIVNQWFHDLCIKLYRKEVEYFESINPFDIKLNKVHEYANQYGILDNKKLNDIKYTNSGYKDNVTEKELDIFIEAYEQIEKYYEVTIVDLNLKLENL
jgi:hypothetical protein